MVRLDMDQNRVRVYEDSTVIGSIELYDNLYHMQNQYLKLDDFTYDTRISEELFRKLHDRIGRPLQIMTASEDEPLIEFIVSGGFVCKRKCYEVEAAREDYIGEAVTGSISRAEKGEKEYGHCCRLLYDRYAETHSAINPLTAELPVFASDLPDCVCYQMREGRIIGFAFVAENEIAYVYGEDGRDFVPFAEALACSLFAQYQTVCFEADDCDRTAMQLKNLFTCRNDVSFDTYIYDCNSI